MPCNILLAILVLLIGPPVIYLLFGLGRPTLIEATPKTVVGKALYFKLRLIRWIAAVGAFGLGSICTYEPPGSIGYAILVGFAWLCAWIISGLWIRGISNQAEYCDLVPPECNTPERAFPSDRLARTYAGANAPCLPAWQDLGILAGCIILGVLTACIISYFM